MNGVMAHNPGPVESSTGILDRLTDVTGQMSDEFTLAAASIVWFGLIFSALKGKYGFLVLAFLVPGIGTIISVVGGIRLAKPRSYWARHLYDRKAMAAAIERHEPPINLEDYPEPKLRKGYRQPTEPAA